MSDVLVQAQTMVKEHGGDSVGPRLSHTQRISRRTPLEELLPLPMPLGINIEPTNRCNFRCGQCPTSLPQFESTVGFRGHMEWDLYEKVIRDIAAAGRLRKLGLFGDGEPFLNPDLIRMIELARRLDVSDMQVITTNGSIMTPQMAEGLIRSGLTDLRVSVYSIYPDRFRSVTGSVMSANKIYANVALVRETRERLRAKTPFLYVKMIDTYGEENEAFQQCFRGVADEVNIETPMNWNGYDGIDLISFIDERHQTDEKAIQGYYEQRGRPNPKEVCTYPFHSLCVKANGDVTICIVDWNKGTKVGNLREQSLADVWGGAALREFRRMHIERRRHENASCRNCKFLCTTPENIDHLPRERLDAAIR
jgi:radical SAM protein with 4Fe4S-binding SPASM domain